MTNAKTSRRALVCSVIALMLCFAMLVGTTFAWFTDEVTSGGNIIKSGTLDVEMYYGDSADAITTDASDVDYIFNYDLWEPGYTQVKYVKIANVGNLAFKYQLQIVPNMNVADGEADLAEVIDVYMFDTTATIDRAAIAAATPVGTLADLIADADGAAYGVLLPENGSDDHAEDTSPVGSVEYAIVLKMQEDAGNEYQNLSIGGESGFAVKLYATQYTWENDSFDHEYDKDADYNAAPKAIVTPTTVEGIDWANYSLYTVDGTNLNTAYIFKAPEDAAAAAENPYASWHADFVVSFDQDIDGTEEIGLAGNYGGFGWIGALADEAALDALADAEDVTWVNSEGVIEKGTQIRLLKDIVFPSAGANSSINYLELCRDVVEFTCGAWTNNAEAADGVTMTVELRLYEAPSTGTTSTPEVETGKSVIIGTYSYTF